MFNGRSDEGLGYCVGWAGCNPNEVKRLFYRIDTSRFAGTRVMSAEFVVRNTHSAQCTDHPVELWRTKAIGASTTWNTQSASGFWVERLRTESFHYGGGQSGCRPAGDAEFDVRAAIQRAADAKTSTLTFGLRASNETSNLHWKRFSKDAHLRVRYNRPPRQIAMSQLTMEYGGTCKSSASAPHVRTMGKIHANNVTDPDGDTVRVQFQVRNGSTVVWDSGLTTAKKSGSAFNVTLPTSLPKNTVLNWQARAYDGAHYGPWSAAGTPTACYFVYNTMIPAAPAIDSGHYPESDPSDPEDPWWDGVGQYGDFTLASSDGDVNRFRYGINTDPLPGNQIATTNGAARLVKVLPEKPGLHFITAQAIDRAGNASEVRTYQYRVASGQPERAVWELDDGPGVGEAVGSAPLRPASLHGGATPGVVGKNGTGLHLNGTDAHLTTDFSMVDARRGHSVSAWVKLDRLPDEAAIIISQRGSQRPDLGLYYSAGLNRWVFNHRTTDDAGTTRIIRAMAPQPGGVEPGV
ncbi:DNRLRE domain-containing protein [Streptomyces alkaliphilus]|nr:DNRLRE domain-containing protein [Streptomyces alkaliphilus]